MRKFKPDVPIGDTHALHYATKDGIYALICRVRGSRYWLPRFAAPKFLTGERCCPICYSPLPKVEAPSAD